MMGYKKMRKKYKTSSPYVGNWLKWMKRKIKGENKFWAKVRELSKEHAA